MRGEAVFRLGVAALAVLLCAGLAGTASAYAASNPPLPRKVKPEPTYVFDDGTTIYVLFKFGAWIRVAYNNSQAVPPIMVYVYSHGLPVELRDNYNHTVKADWGLALNVSNVKIGKYYELWVKYKGKTYYFRFKPVKAIKEQRKKEKTITLALSEFREWLDREAQAATVAALAAVAVAVWLKRRLLLVSTFNAVNMAVVFGGGILIYMAATRLGHSGWLVAPWVLGYIMAYKVYPVGRKLKLLRLDIASRSITAETAVVYSTSNGLAVAKQSLGEAIRRWFGKHVYIVDAEVRKVGVLPSEKVWRYNDADTLESYDAILVLDAEMKKARIKHTEEGWILDERDQD